MRRALLAAAVLLAGCADDPLAPNRSPLRPPVQGPMVAALLRGDVDVASGTLTFTPLDAPLAQGTAMSPSLARYGTQGVTIRLSNTPVTATGCAPTCIDTARVGIRNMLAASIGDEQAGDHFPVSQIRDTMGIYVYFTAGPTRTAGTGADPVLTNQHGTMDFDALNQKYFWYRSRLLGETGGAPRAAGLDTTQNVATGAPTSRHVWKFSRANTVTNYSFTVLVQAPIDTETVGWAINWPGDSQPDLRAEPRWSAARSSVSTWTITEDAGPPTDVSIIAAANATNREYIREDSVRSAGLGYIEVIVRQTTSSTRNSRILPIAYFGINDGTRMLAAGIDGTRVGFVSATAGAFLAGTPTFTVTTTSDQTYRLVKNGTGNVQLYVNGTLRLTYAYANFNADPDVVRSSFYFFGHRSNSTTGGQSVAGTTWTSFWNNVSYKVGAVN